MAQIVKKGSDRDALKAAQDILDRCAIGTESKQASPLVQVHAPTPHTAVDIGTLNTDATTDEQLAGARSFIQKLREAIANAPALPEGQS